MTPHDEIEHGRQSAYKNADIRGSTIENISSLFSLSSFGSAQWPPCVDVKVGGSVILGSSSSSNLSKWAPKRNSSLNRKAQDPGSLRNEQWTAMERAERVSRDSALLNLLEVEVEKSGVVTAGGYRAVHQKFLYSDVVEEEMSKGKRYTSGSVCDATSLLPAAPPTKRGSRFGDLVKSINPRQRGSFSANDAIFTKKDSFGSDSAWIEHQGPLSSSICNDHNLAPRRSSLSLESLAPPMKSLSEKEKEDLRGLDEESVNSLPAKKSFVSSSCEDVETPRKCHIPKAAAILREVGLDSEEADVKLNSIDGSEWEEDDASSVDSLSSELSYEDECGWLPWPLEQSNILDGSSHKEDECGDD